MLSNNSHTGDDFNPYFLLREDLLTFTDYVFSQLYPQTEFLHSPHLAVMAAKLQQCLTGECKRLMILLPPRSGKSILTSVAFPAWVLGRDPTKQMVCISYAQDLADKLARDTRTIMNSKTYKQVFATRLSREKYSVNDFYTTAEGFRMATSVGGVLTGRGGDIVIIDDPLKPVDAYSETMRVAVNHWYENTLLSRLNEKKDGVIIIVMQRLHQDDLVGHILEKEKGWEVLRFPAIAEEDELHRVPTSYGDVVFRRKVGDVLDARRDSPETLLQLRQSMGTYLFDAQYQQNPQPEGGAIIKTAWLRYYKPGDLPPYLPHKFQSWDTANKSGELHDYSVCTTWGVHDNCLYLLDVFRKKMEYPELRRAVVEQYWKHKPRTVVIEDRGSGTQLLQELRPKSIPLTRYSPPPGNDKLMRLVAQSGVFESGRVFLPESAPWLYDYVKELTSFPGSKFDDQVDSTTQALGHFEKLTRNTVTIRELRL